MDGLPVLSHHETIVQIPVLCHGGNARIQNKVLNGMGEADKIKWAHPK